MRLKLNADKTKYITFGSRIQLQKVSSSPLIAGNDVIQMSSDVKYLGWILYNKLNFNKHITTKIKKPMSKFISIMTIWKYLSKRACITLVFMLCILHLDYGNALLYGLPKKSIKRVQTVQNIHTKLVLQCSKLLEHNTSTNGSSLAPNRTVNSIQDTHNHTQRHKQDCTKIYHGADWNKLTKEGQHAVKQCRNKVQCTTSKI